MACCSLSSRVVTLIVTFSMLVFYMLIGALMFTAIEFPHETKGHNRSINRVRICPIIFFKCYSYNLIYIVCLLVKIKEINCSFQTFCEQHRTFYRSHCAFDLNVLCCLQKDIVGKGSQIETKQKPESTVFQFLIGQNL